MDVDVRRAWERGGCAALAGLAVVLLAAILWLVSRACSQPEGAPAPALPPPAPLTS